MVKAFVVPQFQAANEHGVLAYVQLSPVRRGIAQRYGDGRWILGLFDDGSPLIWERLPDETSLNDETQVRHLTTGPDGAIYLMRETTEGVVILRRER